MLNPLLSHLVKLPMYPTPAQALTLLRFSQAHHLAELLALEQANLAGEGWDVALAALVGGPGHRERLPAVEAAALAATPLFADCPSSVLDYAILSYRARLNGRAECHQELPQVGASRGIAGHGLVLYGGPDTLSITGVGQVRADLTRLPAWALDALRRGPVHDGSCVAALDQIEIVYSGGSHIEREWNKTGWTWSAELDFAETW